MSDARYENDAQFKENVDRNVIELKAGRKPTVHADPEVLIYAQALVSESAE